MPGLRGRKQPRDRRDPAAHDGRGHRVVAARPFAKGALLAVWGGDVLTRAQVEALAPGDRRLALQVDEDAFLFSTREGPADWVNHACEPNAGLSGQVSLVAMRDIAVGEEICFDYAMSDGCPYDEFDCHCGSPICRGRVRGDDWRLPELIERYAGYRSPYLDRRIERLASARPSRRRSQKGNDVRTGSQ